MNRAIVKFCLKKFKLEKYLYLPSSYHICHPGFFFFFLLQIQTPPTWGRGWGWGAVFNIYQTVSLLVINVFSFCIYEKFLILRYLLGSSLVLSNLPFL